MKIKMRSVAVIVMVIAMVVSMMPTAGLAAPSETVSVSDWGQLIAAINDDATTGKTIVLSGDITAGEGDSCLNIKSKTVSIDLNGKTLNRNRTSQDASGHVFWVCDNSSLTIKDSAGGGLITGGWAKEGGAIQIQSGSTLNLEGGTVSGNKADEGGAIFSEGALNIYGGTISSNTATDGGALFIKSGSMDQTGGAVKDNTANRGGGMVVHGTVRITQGDVTGNSTLKGEYGGGVYVADNGTFVLNGGTISDNVSNYDGGGIYTEGTVEIIDGSVSQNKTAANAGAICIRDGRTTISGGSINKNTAYQSGGAIHISKGWLTLTGGSISHNTGINGGGGIWMDSKTGSIELSGKPVVQYNTSNDIHLSSGRKLVVNGPLEEGARVGVYMADISGTFTQGFKDNNPGADASLYFTPETGYSIANDAEGEANVIASEWLKLQRMINAAENGETLSITNDWKAISENDAIVIPEGKSLTLNMNGHTIDRALESYREGGEVMIVKGSLTLTDNLGGGRITGGYGDGGGIRIESGGTLNLENVSITGNRAKTGAGVLVDEGAELNIDGGLVIHNKADDKGGGVYNKGTFNFNKGMISTNQAGNDGGGIYNSGEVKITQGAIVMVNRASGNGGALYVAKDGESAGLADISGGSINTNNSKYGGAIYLGSGSTLNLSGGNIALNHAAEAGGGILLESSEAAFNVKGSPYVRSNGAASGKNIKLNNGGVVNITEKLSENAVLDVATDNTNNAMTRGLTAINEGSMAAFTYNENTQDVLEIRDNELFFTTPPADLWVGSWEELEAAIQDPANREKTIGLNQDVINNEERWIEVITDTDNNPVKVAIELNGHNIDGNYKKTIFYIGGSAELTIRDSAGTGSVRNGEYYYSGGGIIATDNSNIILENVAVLNNYTGGGWGGGLNISGKANLKMTGGRFSGNKTGYAFGGGIFSTSDGTIELKGVSFTDNLSYQGGHAISVSGKTESYVKIEDCFIVNNDNEDDEWDAQYGAVTVDKPVKLDIINTMFSGNVSGARSNNTWKSFGGALSLFELCDVFITGSTFMHNKSESGGAIYSYPSVQSLKIENTNFSDNEDSGDYDLGGGAIYSSVDNHTVRLDNCTFTGNHSANNGGAIMDDVGNISINNCTFENNSASGDGGAVYAIKRYLEINDCTLSGNKASGSGGGICLVKNDGRLNNVTVTGNKADNCGGGIFFDEGNVDVNGATVTGNTALETGDGIYVADEDGDFKISGNLQVTGNEGTDLYLEEDVKVKVTGSLTGSRIGIAMKDNNTSFTKGYRDHNPDEHPSKIFLALPGYSVVQNSGGEAELIDSDWPNLQNQITEALSDAGAGEVNTLVLDKDWSAHENDSTLIIPSGKALILDLNGHTIDRGLSSYKENGEVITVKGSLTIRDSADGIGKITGGYGGGGGIDVYEGGSVVLEGGRITGNHGNVSGGGILNHAGGTVVIKGGEISSNSTKEFGGAIYSEGSLVISGGSITSNEAKGSGGAVALRASGTLELSGGEIKGNTAGKEGGGIWFDADAAVNAQGNPVVTENSAPTGKNILLKPGKLLGINGALTEGAKLDLNTQNVTESADTQLTSGLKNGASAETATGFFTYNNSGNERLKAGGGENYELYLTAPIADAWAGSWSELMSAINADENQGKTIALKNDITASDDDDRLLLDHKNVTVDLNGHKLNRNLDDDDSDGHVFELSYSTLTIKDSAGTGVITGGYAKHGGAINIHEHSVLNFESGTISGNRATDSGGGIYVYGTLNMTGGTISDNSADAGGGIYCNENASKDGETVSLKNVLIQGNYAEKNGGGIDTHAGMTIEDCVIKSNSVNDDCGGGIYVYSGDQTVNLNNTRIEKNTADDNGGGMHVDVGTVVMKGGKVSGNHTGDRGGGVYVNEKGVFTSDKNDNGDRAEISGNNADDCGGIYIANGNATINNTLISDNEAKEYGGAGINNKGKCTVTDSEISNNKAKAEGGGIYNDGSSFTLTRCTISGNEAEGDGGAASINKNTDFIDCTISDNKTKLSGGGLRIRNCTVNITGGSISANEAESYGGGIYINNDAVLNLKDHELAENIADLAGGGIYVASETGAVNLAGKIIADSNNSGGSNIHLVSGKKITFSDALSDDSRIGVVMEAEVEHLKGSPEFTSGFAEKNPGKDPAVFFISDDGYEVVWSDDLKEAKLDWVTDEDKPFIEKNSQIVRDYTKLSNKNWMAGISGERYLNEINIPGTHDSGTKEVEGNISTGMLSVYSAVATVVLANAAGILLSGVTAGTSLIAGNIFGWAGMGIAPVLVSEYFKKYANCQERYIDEQLDDGIRQLDIRLNTYYSEFGYPPNKNDNGEDLYLLHGKDKNAGSYFCKDHDDNFLTFKTVLEWCRAFLEKHPTETIIMSVQIDSVDIDDVYNEGIARIKEHLRVFSEKTNPSTGESYLYMENNTFGKPYSHIPKLKDCRGQIVLLAADKETEIFGGGTSIGQDCKNTYRPQGSYKDNYEPKIKHLTDFYNRYGGRPLPEDAGEDSHLDYYFSVGTNGTDTKIPPDKTPLEIRDKVFEALFSDNGLLMNRTGTYLGLVNMDGVHAKQARIVWETNFFDRLKYCTVTAKSGDDDSNPKTYTVLAGTTILIPGGVYRASSDSVYFAGWKTDVPSEGHGEDYIPGEYYTVTKDVTFTAKWVNDEMVPVSIDWKDGDNKDTIRPETVTVKVTKEGGATENVELKAENKWQTMITGKIVNLEPVGELYGDDGEGTYKSAASSSADRSHKLTLTHTPSAKLSGKGSISWEDNDNSLGKRPESVTLSIKGGDMSATKTVTAADNWSFDFGDLPQYKNGEEIEYTVTQNEVAGHSQLITGLDVKNILKPESAMLIHGWVIWGDNEGKEAERPQSVTLHLMKNGTEVAQKEITRNSDGEWPFSFNVEKGSKYSDYTITADPVEGYQTSIEMGSEEGDIAHVLYVADGHTHSEAEYKIPILPATCTDTGSTMVLKVCSSCGTTLDIYAEKIPALGHDWGSWSVLKEATQTEEGEKTRTCKNDSRHVETVAIPIIETDKGLDKVYDLSKAVVTVPDYTEDEYKEKQDSDVTVKIGNKIIDPVLYTVNWPEIETIPETNARLTVTATDAKKSGYTAKGTSPAARFAVKENAIPESEAKALIEKAQQEAEEAKKAAEDAKAAQEAAEKAEADAKKEAEDAKAAQEAAEKAEADAKKEAEDAKAKQEAAEKTAAEAEKTAVDAKAKQEAAEAAAEEAKAKQEAAEAAAEEAKARKEAAEAAAKAAKAKQEAAEATAKDAKAKQEAAEAAAKAAKAKQEAAEATAADAKAKQAAAEAAEAAAKAKQEAADKAAAQAKAKQIAAEQAAEEAKAKQKAAEKAAAQAKAKQKAAEEAAAQAKLKAQNSQNLEKAIAEAAQQKAGNTIFYTAVAVADQKVTYNGKAVSVKAVVMGSSGKVTYKYYSDKACTKPLKKAPVNAGTWYVKAFVESDGMYFSGESNPAKITILKAKNKMKVKAKTVKVKAKKTAKIKKAKAFKVKNAKGKVTFKKKKGNKKIVITKKGIVKVKKGLKKGKIYKVKVKVTAKGNKNYLKKTKTVTLRVKVR